jgi:hypothetical protein
MGGSSTDLRWRTAIYEEPPVGISRSSQPVLAFVVVMDDEYKG